MSPKKPQIKKRKAEFATRIVTKIWDEEPLEKNPYLANKCRCHGYDLLELIESCSFVEILYLLFIGELPNTDQTALLETLMIGLINPGPRHPATSAAMNAGISRTNRAHILPIALSVLSGAHLGGEEVESAMRFLLENIETEPEKIVKHLLKNDTPHREGDWHIAPGFGNHFGGIDPAPQQVANICNQLPGRGKALKWSNNFVSLIKHKNMGWLSTGIAAAVFTDLGFHPHSGSGLFQIISAPGLLAHGLEMSTKPITAMPFLDEEHYVIAPEARTKNG